MPRALVDSHCHLNADRFEGDVDLVARRRPAGRRRADPRPGLERRVERAGARARRALPVARRGGRRPSPRRGQGRRRGLGADRRLAADPRVVAIGETGLDYDRVFSPIPDQLTNLRRNLALALETGKPAILHCRSADGRRDAQDALLDELRAAGVGGPALGARRSATGRRRSSTRSRARSTTRRAVLDLGLADQLLGARLPARRGGVRRRSPRSCPRIGSSSRPIRRSWRRPARRARATSRSGCAITAGLAGRAARGRRSTRSGRPSSTAYDRTFPSRDRRTRHDSSPHTWPHRPARRGTRCSRRRPLAAARPRARRRARARASSPPPAPRRRASPSTPTARPRERRPRAAAGPTAIPSPSPAAGACAVDAADRRRCRPTASRRLGSSPAPTADSADVRVRHGSLAGPAAPPTGDARAPPSRRSPRPPAASRSTSRASTPSRSGSAACRCPTTSASRPTPADREYSRILPALKQVVMYDESEGVVGWYIGYDGTAASTLVRDGNDVMVTIAHA